MVTFYKKNNYIVRTNEREVEVRCLSTDEKPTVLPNGNPIANGTSLFEIDTGKLFLYNSENEQWNEVE